MINLLIVDDEEFIRKGLEKAVDWNELGYSIVGTAENGINALRIIEEQRVDAVLTDIRMPKMSGLELASSIAEKYPDIKVVILSGYGDFTYAKEAIRNNVFDYLLKPSKEEEIKNVFNKLSEVLKTEKKNRLLLNSNILDISQKFFSDLILNRALPKDFPYYTKLLDAFIGIESEIKFLLTLEISLNHPYKNEQKSTFLNHNINQIREIADTWAKPNTIPYFSLENNEISFLLIGAPCKKTIHELFEIIISQVCRLAQENTDVLVSGGVSQTFQNLQESKDCYYQSKAALKHRVYLGKNKLILFDDVINHRSQIPEINVEATASKIVSLICAGNMEEAKKNLGTMFEKLVEACVYSADFLFMICYKLILFINQNFKDLGYNTEKILPPMEIILNSLKSMDTIHESCVYFENLIHRLNQSFHDPEKDTVRKIIEQAVAYIKINYNRDIKLETLANQLGISHTYLSRLFKSELNINFKDYLTDLRLEKAKELLLDPSLKVYEISELAGYMDQRYFSEVFKLRVGMTPLEYREKVRIQHDT